MDEQTQTKSDEKTIVNPNPIHVQWIPESGCFRSVEGLKKSADYSGYEIESKVIDSSWYDYHYYECAGRSSY